MCRTRIPDSMKIVIAVEKLTVIQAYKQYILLECRPCLHVFTAEIHEQSDWSCPACAEQSFYSAFGRTSKVGGKTHERAYTRTDRRIGDTSGGTCQWNVAA